MTNTFQSPNWGEFRVEKTYTVGLVSGAFLEPLWLCTSKERGRLTTVRSVEDYQIDHGGNSMADAFNGNRSILVVGSGMSGLSAALEAAEAGFQVYMVEKEPYLGGRVARMNKYFPKLCPPSCGLEINFRRIKNNPLIRFFTMAQVEKIQGEAGNFDVTVTLQPRYVNEKCTGCGTCVDHCPVLALWGENDLLVPPVKSSEYFRNKMIEIKNPDATVKIIFRADHTLTFNLTGKRSETISRREQYKDNPSMVFAPGAVELMVEWLTKRND